MRKDQRSTMGCEASISLEPTSIRRHHHAVLPPWEVRSVSQVLFIEPGSPPLARKDEQGFFAVGSTPRANHRQKLSATMTAPCASEHSSPVAEHSSSSPWKGATPESYGQVPTQPSYKTPISRGAIHCRPACHATNNFNTVFHNTSSQNYTAFVPQAPPTPPDSVYRCPVRSISASPSLRPTSAMNNIGIETWLMHGSLLGWHWNRKVLPWDHDLDVQVSLQGMRHLVDYHNTTFPAVEPLVARDRHRYLLDINPNWANADTSDGGNKIDARFVDTMIGLYADITVLHRDNRAAAQGNKRVMMCKDGHRYNYEDIFPLQATEFEGVASKVPSSSASVLTKEYAMGSLNNTVYGDHRFDADLGEWVYNFT